MSLITTVDGIPLYTTIQEALSWAVSNNLSGHHQHTFKEQIGYMGGESHAIAVQGPVPTPVPIVIPTPIPTPESTTTTTTTTPIYTSGGTGGGGGGY